MDKEARRSFAAVGLSLMLVALVPRPWLIFVAVVIIGLVGLLPDKKVIKKLPDHKDYDLELHG